MKKRSIVAIMLAGSLWYLPSGAAEDSVERPQACETPSEAMDLYVKKIGKGRLGYGLTPGSVSIPGPTIELTEGECLAINLINRTDKKVSFHPHGVDYTVASDGTSLNDSCVAPKSERTYVVSSRAPQVRADGNIDLGNAGYWHYHDHCHGTKHGTGGVRKGLYGALVVRRQGDAIPDKQFVLVMNNISFNNQLAPNTPHLEATEGERVEFIVIAHGELLHTFHLHGHRWADNRTGTLTSPEEDATLIDNKAMGPADSFGFQVIAGEDVGPGAWMYHCHVQSHSDLGMAGLFVVEPIDGVMPRSTVDAIKAFQSEHAHAGHGDHGARP